MLPTAVINPSDRRLPPWILPVAVTKPLILTLLASILPVTLTTAPVWLAVFTIVVNIPLLAVTLPNRLIPVVVNMATGVIPVTLTVTLPLAATVTFELPLMIWLPVAIVRLVSWLPSPIKYAPVLAVMFPVTLTTDPVWLAAFTMVAITLLAVTLPDTETTAPV